MIQRLLPFARVTLAIVALCMAAWMSPVSAVEYGTFTEFTLYSKDGLTSKDFQDDVIVVFHGFASAMPNGTYKAIHRAMKDTHTVVGFNYDYVDVAGTISHFDALHREALKGKRVTLAGTSLGGFWAHYFTNRYGIAKLVVINPMIDPSSNLMKKLGEHFSERRNKTFVVTADAVRSFESVIVPESAETRRLVILSKHDPAIDPEPALETFWNAAKTDLVVYDTDIHTLPLKNHPAMRLIREFILRDYIN